MFHFDQALTTSLYTRFHALAVYLHPTLTAEEVVGYFRRRGPWMFDRILNATLLFTPKIGNIRWNVWRRSPEFLMTFPGIFGDVPRNVWRHFPEYLVTFPGMFGDIPRNVL